MEKHLLEKACYFDSIGILVKKNESIETYIKRAETTLEFCNTLRQKILSEGKVALENETICKDQLLEDNESGFQKVKNSFDFDLKWIIGFYDSSIGFLQGAAEGIYADDTISDIPFICLKPSFKKKDIYLKMYKKDECIAHELVHASREGLCEKKYHELFAYTMNSNFGARYLPGFIRWAWESYAVFSATVFGFIYTTFYDIGSITGYIPLILFMSYLL